MALYAISDLHLSLSGDKPMDVFSEEWKNHDVRIRENWLKKVRQRDFTGDCGLDETLVWLEKCRQSLQLFADQVFHNENPDHDTKMKYDPGSLNELKD